MDSNDESPKSNNGEEYVNEHRASLHCEETNDVVELEDVEISGRLVSPKKNVSFQNKK